MRARSECRVNENLKEGYVETVRPGSNRRRETERLRGVFAQIKSKHKHKDVTGRHECQNMTERQTNRN